MCVTSRQCPLASRWEGEANTAVRLQLYIPRHMWRWYNCDDGERRKFAGQVCLAKYLTPHTPPHVHTHPTPQVVSVSDDAKFTVKYDAGDTDVLTEAQMLKVFATMKKDLAKQRRLKVNRGRKRRRP